MDITMYDCGFGDCFLIHNADSNLLVDCGIHCSCPSVKGRAKDQVINDILADINNIRPKSFLLTHYHDDHFNGIANMISGIVHPHTLFDDVYIPDVWDPNISVSTLALLMVSDISYYDYYHRRYSRMDLYRFCRMLTRRRWNHIHLVSTDPNHNQIETGKYIALWPNKGKLRRRADIIWESLGEEYADLRENMQEYSRQLINYVRPRIEHADRDFDIENDESLFNIVGQIEDYYENNIEAFDSLNAMHGILLNNFENNVSIVFHNALQQLFKNVLFTGDITRSILKKEILPYLYENYSVVKAPHHGTKPYYLEDLCDKIADTQSWLLIPFGYNNQKWVPALEYYDYCFNNKPQTSILCSNDFTTNKEEFSV